MVSSDERNKKVYCLFLTTQTGSVCGVGGVYDELIK